MLHFLVLFIATFISQVDYLKAHCTVIKYIQV